MRTLRMFAHIVLLCGTLLPINAQQYQESNQFGQGFNQNNGRLPYFPPTANQVRYQSNFPIERLDPDFRGIFAQYQQVDIESITSEKPRPRFDRDLRPSFVENGNRNPYPGQVQQFPFPPWDRRNIFFSSPLPQRAEENFNTVSGRDIQGYNFPPYSPHQVQIQRSFFSPRPMETPFFNNQVPSQSQPNLPSGLLKKRNPVATFWFILPLLKHSSLGEAQVPNMNPPIFPESKKEMEEHLQTHEERIKTFLGLMSKMSEILPKNQVDNYPLSEEKGANFDEERRVDQAIRLLKFFRCLIQMKKDAQGGEQSENSKFPAINEPKLEEKPLVLAPKIVSSKIRFEETPKPLERPKDRLVEDYHNQKLEDQVEKDAALHELHHLYHQKKDENNVVPTQKSRVLFQKKEDSSEEVFDDFHAKLHDLYQKKRLDSSSFPKEKDDFVDKLAKLYQEEKMKTPKSWPSFKAEKFGLLQIPKIPSEFNEDSQNPKQVPKGYQGAQVLTLDITPKSPKKNFDQKFDDFEKKTIKEHLGAPILKLEILPKSSEPQKSMEPKVRQVSRLDKLFQDQKKEKHRNFHARIEELSKEEDNAPFLKENGVQSNHKEENNSVPSLEVLPLIKAEESKVKFIEKSQLIAPKKEKTAPVFQSPERYASNFEMVPTLPTEKSVEIIEPNKNEALHPTPKTPNLQEENSSTFQEKLITKLVALEGKLKQINKNPMSEKNGDNLEKTKAQEEKPGTVMNMLQGAEEYQKHQQHLDSKEGTSKKDKLELEKIQESVEEKIMKKADEYKKQKLDEIYGPLASKLVQPEEQTQKPANKIGEKENRPNLKIIQVEKGEDKPITNQFWKDTSGLALKTKFQADQSSLEKNKEDMPAGATKFDPTLIEAPKGSFVSKDNQGSLHLLGDKSGSFIEDISKKVASHLEEENKDKSSPGNKKESASPGVYENKILERTINELSEKNSTTTTTPKSEDERTNKEPSSWSNVKESSSFRKNKVPESSEPQISTSTPIPSSTTEKRPTTKDPFMSALKVKYLPAKKSNSDLVSFEDDNEEEEEPSTKSSILTSILFKQDPLKKLKYNFGTEDLRTAQAEKMNVDSKKDEDIGGEDKKDESSEDEGSMFTSFPFQLIRNLF